MAASLMNKIPEKYNLMIETPTKDGLDHTPRRKKKHEKADVTEQLEIFNPDITERTSKENAVRIFGTNQTYKTRRIKANKTQTRPAYRQENNRNKK